MTYFENLGAVEYEVRRAQLSRSLRGRFLPFRYGLVIAFSAPLQ